MKTTLFGLGVAMALGVALISAQTAASDNFKLGTFEQGGRTFVGIVLNDALVADLEGANSAYERETPGAQRVTMPADMKTLIEQYPEGGLRERLQALARSITTAKARPAYVRDLKSLRTRPPIMYPGTILNAAVNFTEHAAEMAGRGGIEATPAKVPDSIPGLWQRKAGDTRHNPYLFPKPSAAVIGDGDAIRLPPGREQIDWECEIALVVGRTATRVPVDKASTYIFGYTLENDVSDRGARGDGRHGSDWLIGKGHDTFAPMGPFIVPKELIKDPQKLAIKFTLSGKIMQDSNTDRMTHTANEMLSFASHIITLRPGDVVSLGSPAGVGTARATPIYFKAGDVSVCTIEGIGTLTNPVVGPSPAPSAASR